MRSCETPTAFFVDPLEELAGQLEVDVGLEQDAPHVAEAVLDVGFGQRATAAELRERGFELGGEFVEHRALKSYLTTGRYPRGTADMFVTAEQPS